MNEQIEKIELALQKYISNYGHAQYSILAEAMEYSLMAGGKRIRPQLLLEFFKICGGEGSFAMPFACAIEMIHTYSLIHDDLPCMDNARRRREKPANHIVFGEATALLAGDALLTMAFEITLCEQTLADLSTEQILRNARAAGKLARYAGAEGMVAGQILDLLSGQKKLSLEDLKQMDEKKTGCLIVAAAEIGCILAGASKEQIAAARDYSKNLGLAFQIVDDILDVTSGSDTLGKDVGNDANFSKFNYVSLLGVDEAKKLVGKITNEAIDALKDLNGDTSKLKGLAVFLTNRSK